MKINKPIFTSTIAIFIIVIVLLIWLKPNFHPTSSDLAPPTTVTNTAIPQAPNRTVTQPHIFNPKKEGIYVAKNGDPLIGSFESVNYDNIKQLLKIPLDPEQVKDGRIFVKYDPSIVESKKVGDSFRIVSTELGIGAIGKITSVTNLDSDIRQWLGGLNEGSPQTNHFRITRSVKDNYTLMVIYTDQGIYEMESKNNVGWIRPSTFKIGNDEHNAY